MASQRTVRMDVIAPPRRMRSSWRIRLQEILVEGTTHLLLAFFAIVAFGGLVWMVLASFKTSSEIIRMPPTFLRQAPTLASYKLVLPSNPLLAIFSIVPW